MLNIRDRLSELDVLLNNVDNEDWLKIPEDIIIGIKQNKNENYVWEYDSAIPFEDHDINNDTLMLFLLIMYKYIANNEEKQQINKILEENTTQYNEKYDIDSVFTKSYLENVEEKENKKSEKSLIESKESFWIKIKKFVISFFKK